MSRPPESAHLPVRVRRTVARCPHSDAHASRGDRRLDGYDLPWQHPLAMKKYDALPMNMGEAAIAAATAELLGEARTDPRPEPLIVAEALVGMISRQSGLYRPFAPEVAARIEDWANEVWATEPLALFDALATVAANLGSERMRSRLEAARRHPDAVVRAIAKETLAEM